MSEYLDLLSEVGSHIRLIRMAEARYADVLAPDFDPFGFFATREMRLSKVLAWMLDPNESHAQGSLYLQLFLDVCAAYDGIDPHSAGLVLSNARVEVERSVSAHGVSKGRIDIEVRGGGLLLLIENKPDADFQEDQLHRYNEAVVAARGRYKRLVVLRGWGEHSSDDIQRGDIALKLGEEIAEWVDQCSTRTKADDVRIYLRRFAIHLIRRFGGANGSRELTDISKLLGQSPVTIKQALQIAAALPALKRSIIVELYERANILGAEAGVPVYTLPGEARLPDKFGYLRFDIGHADFDFALSSDKTDLNETSYGIVFRKDQRGFRKNYAEQRQKIIDAWGAGDGEDGNEYWMWWEAIPSLIPTYAADNQAGLWAACADKGENGILRALISKAIDAKTILGAPSAVGAAGRPA